MWMCFIIIILINRFDLIIFKKYIINTSGYKYSKGIILYLNTLISFLRYTFGYFPRTFVLIYLGIRIRIFLVNMVLESARCLEIELCLAQDCHNLSYPVQESWYRDQEIPSMDETCCSDNLEARKTLNIS